MKRGKTILTVIAAVVVCAGIVVLGGLLGRNDRHFDLFQTKLVTDTVQVKAPFRDIAVRAENESVTLLPSKDGQCSVVIRQWEGHRHKVYVRDGVLVADAQGGGGGVHFFSLLSAAPEITVYLPVKTYSILTVGASTGAVEVPGDFTFDRMNLSVTTGAVRCAASAEEDLTVSASTGEVRLTDLTAASVDVTVSTGKAELMNVDCYGAMSVTASTGKAELTNVACRDFTSTGTTGDIVLENTVAAGNMDIRRSTGEVKFINADAEALTVTTSTGDVTGSLRTGKTFHAESGTGTVDVPATTGGPCRVTTSTGKIALTVG